MIDIATNVSEQRMDMAKLTAWMTASLIGFSNVPAFAQCFPDKSRSEGTVGEIEALFASIGAEVRRAR